MAKKVEYKGINEELQLSTVECLDAGHEYIIRTKDNGYETKLQFIKGGRNTPDSIPGLDHQSLMIVIIDRIKYFKELFPNSTDNDRTLELLEETLAEMDARTIARANAGTLGNDGSDYEDGE